ncbi:MAG: IS5 family transposase [Candidatus Nitrosotenuis sp.]
MIEWNQYNEKLVRRGEILISGDCFKSWDKELAEMNRKKQGRKFLFPESFMKLVGYARAYFGLPYRQTEGLLRTYDGMIPKVPDYTAIHKRINKLDVKINPEIGTDDIVIAVDSTGIKVANRGEWMRDKWNRRRGFLKIHVGVDVNSKKIVSLKITDERSHDAKHLPSLVHQASHHGKVIKALADAAYDSKSNFSHLYYNDIVPGIKVRKNSSGRSNGCYPRMVSVISQLGNYQHWRDSVSYGKRWIVESVFSALKRIFGEHVMAHKRHNMEKELQLKVALYNRFMVP